MVFMEKLNDDFFEDNELEPMALKIDIDDEYNVYGLM